MYPYKDFLISLCKAKEKTTNIKQIDVMISQRGMPKNPESSFDAIDEQEIPRPTAPTSQANGSKNLKRSYVRESLSQAFDEEVTDIIDTQMKSSKLPSRIGNDQQLSRNMTAQKATKSVNAELSANDSESTSPYQFDALSGFSKKMPLYQIACKNEGALSHETSSNQDASLLYSLDNLVESAIDFQVESAMSNTQAVNRPMTTHGGYPSQGTLKDTVAELWQSCPSTCPCLCHVPSQSVLSPSPVFNEERRSVIMAPVGGNCRTSRVTHTPLQIEDNVNKPLSTVLGQEIASRMVDVSDDSDDSDEEEHFFRNEIDGLKVKFKLTLNDWKLIQMNKFPSGGRSLGGAWTSIFKRGVRESNPWCSLRFKNNHVRTENSRKKNSAPFFRGAAECKRRECTVRLKFVIKEESGKYVKVTYIGNVCHKI